MVGQMQYSDHISLQGLKTASAHHRSIGWCVVVDCAFRHMTYDHRHGREQDEKFELTQRGGEIKLQRATKIRK